MHVLIFIRNMFITGRGSEISNGHVGRMVAYVRIHKWNEVRWADREGAELVGLSDSYVTRNE